ncbi:phosphoglucosamine mutase [Candidatus Bipolaricaulota bacterium]|nr:phosphoglucosamine mutase [Candidatus Bipolaricaulota bacterium]
MTKYFGTDGVRGKANQLLTPEFALSLSRAIAATLAPNGGRVIIGRDTRTSGPMLEAVLSAGLASAGLDVCLAGIIPTPAISFLIKDERADLGIVISASHNPPEDNGIKLFNRKGSKLSQDDETRIEAALNLPHKLAKRIGTISILKAASTRYAAFLSGIIDAKHVDFSGMTLVLDCAYGATAPIAPHVFRHLGATVIPIHCELDGDKINVGCGATDLCRLQEVTREHGADLGIAFDGDGDRVLLVGPDGFVIDGDRMMGIAAFSMAERNLLKPAAIVATILSNRGLELWLEERGIAIHRTAVGDRYVSHRMVEEDIQIGGEASGHVIFRDHSPTGDGILTAVKLLEIAHHCGRDLPSLARDIPLHTQIARNIVCESPSQLAVDARAQELLLQAEDALGPLGRIVLRPSGTQPMLRIMVEAEDATRCEEIADSLEASLRQIAHTN